MYIYIYIKNKTNYFVFSVTILSSDESNSKTLKCFEHYRSKMGNAVSSFFIALKLDLRVVFHVSVIMKREILKVNDFYKNTCYLKISTLLR